MDNMDCPTTPLDNLWVKTHTSYAICRLKRLVTLLNLYALYKQTYLYLSTYV